MEKIDIENIKSIFESTNINLLIGSGLSFGAFNTLEMEDTDNEAKFNKKYYDATKLVDSSTTETDFYSYMNNHHFNYESYIDLLIESEREIEIEKFKKQFTIKNSTYDDVQAQYNSLFKAINNLIMQKDNKKTVNIFTSNYDMLINDALSSNQVSYNDGFYKEKEFELDILDTVPTVQDMNNNFIEIAHYNLIKFHGSLDWGGLNDETIKKRHEPYDESFVGIMPSFLKYNNLLFSYTYYDLINRLKETLSKSNSTLFILGFSIRDEHIKKIIKSALKKNKTLIIVYISFGNDVDHFIEVFNADNKFVKIIPDHYKDIDNFTIENIVKFFDLKLELEDE